MTKKNRKYLSKNNKKNAFYDKYTESKHFKRENTQNCKEINDLIALCL